MQLLDNDGELSLQLHIVSTEIDQSCTNDLPHDSNGKTARLGENDGFQWWKRWRKWMISYEFLLQIRNHHHLSGESIQPQLRKLAVFFSKTRNEKMKMQAILSMAMIVCWIKDRLWPLKCRQSRNMIYSRTQIYLIEVTSKLYSFHYANSRDMCWCSLCQI